MAKIPDRINIDKNDREIYNTLDHEEMLRFKGGRRTRREQFMFSLAVGFNRGLKNEIKNKEGWFNSRELQPEDYAILNAIAIFHTGSVDVLIQPEQIFKIAEEYAHVGIKILSDKITNTQFGSFNKNFEKELTELHKKIKS